MIENARERRSPILSLGVSSFRFLGRRPAWGTDEETGQQCPRVTDNGVGMTRVTRIHFGYIKLNNMSTIVLV